MFPIARSIAGSQQLDPRPIMVTITLAASMAFIPPIGYQTTLMVYGPGNDRLFDFVRAGELFRVLLWIVILVTVSFVWPL